MSQLALFQPPPPVNDWWAAPAAVPAQPLGRRARWYQREIKTAVHAELARYMSTIVVAATGVGKTFTFCDFARDYPGRGLILAHRDELCRQTIAALEQATGELIGLEKAESQNDGERLVVGSIQSFSTERCNRLGKDAFAFIIVDEAHHGVSPTYRRVLEFFNAKVVGFTATPDRADEKGLVAVFESVAYTYEILDAINDGFLCPLDARQVHLDEIDLTDVDSSGGDLAVGQLDEAMRKCVEGVAVKTLELAGDRQGIVFWPGVKSAEAACIRFSALKLGCSAWVYAKTPEHERRAIIKAFRAGQVQFIHNVGVLTEGFDAPESSVVVIARPTKSRGLYAQILGRGLRPAPGTIDQWTERDEAELRRLAIAQSRKPNAMILDFVGNAGKHSLVGPADVLGGNDPDEVVTIARKKVAGGQGDVAQALADARRELEEAMRRTKSTVKARVEAFDPFMVVGESDLQVQKYTRRFGYVSATPGQLGALRKFGLVEKEIAGLSKMAASKLIDTLVARAKSGLVGYKALKRFQGFGVTETDIPRERGKMAMDYIAANGWDRANPVTVRKILLERQPGDEG